MRELQKKQKLKKRMYSIPVLVMLTLLVGLSINGTLEIMKKRAESMEYVRKLEEKSDDLKARKFELDEDIGYLETEAGIDEEIKERFNVAKTGERVVIIVDPKPTASTTEDTSIPWYKRIWSAIIPGR